MNHPDFFPPASCVLMLYFSYAANLNRSHVTRLCPGTAPLYPAVLEDYTLAARRWFNVEPEDGGIVQGGIWRISREHLASLDRYEDFPELYERREVEVMALGKWGRGEEGKRGRGETLRSFNKAQGRQGR